MLENLRERMESAMKAADAQYIEVRVEESEASNIRYRGRDLEEIGRSSGRGGNVRALAGGGWGFASFNNLNDLAEKVREAVHHAQVVGGERIELAPVEPVVDSVPARIGKDPLAIPLADKKAVLDQYVDIIMGTEGVQSAGIGYADGRRRVAYANSEGSFVEQERVDVGLRMSAMARDGAEVQQSGVSLGSLGDFQFMESLHDEAQQVADQSISLLRAPEVTGGEYTVVLDPILAGVFIHEAFGHLSEADHIYVEPRMQELMVLGREFGGKHLNVVDGAAVPNLRGSYRYDDEGVPAHRTDLIREGVLVGRLHSRETAAKLGEQPTGNARAISFRYPPIVRMTNTFIEPGEGSVDDLFAGIKDGLYVKNWYGGMTSMEMFTFSAGEAYRIRDGKIEELCRPVMLSGNLFTTLKNLDAVANDLDMNQGGGCGKGGQSPLPVSNGSPHIRIRQVLIGGGSHS
ncbi:MAG: TldD/PmbA family protein [Dehalococcoidia bacterium]